MKNSQFSPPPPPDTYASLDTVFAYQFVYQLTMSVVLFIRILYFLAPMEVNSHVFLMRRTLMGLRGEFIDQGVIIIFTMLAFSGFFYLFQGPIYDTFKSGQYNG